MDKEQLSRDLLKCAHCGMCLAVCPVYRETLVETDSPRARLALIRSLEESALKESTGYSARIFDCTTCMACSQACPSGVRPDELILEARAKIRRKPFPLQKLVLHHLMPFSSRLRNLFVPLRLYEKSGLRRLVRQSGIPGLFPIRLSRFDAMLPSLSGAPLYRGHNLVLRPSGKAAQRVGYFPGCAQNLAFTSVSQAAVRVLMKNGCQIVIPEGLACCGMPFTGYGDINETRLLARRNISAFEMAGVDYIITDCATCGATLKKYSALLTDDPEYAARARLFSARVRDITEFLMQDIQLNEGFARLSLRTTYHEPCHMGRGQGLKEPPRKLLRLITGDNFIEMAESDSCCGGAGSYTVTHPGLSLKILDRKMKNLKDTEARAVVTACPGCQIQLGQGIRLSRQNVRLLHIIEMLDEAYRAQK